MNGFGRLLVVVVVVVVDVVVVPGTILKFDSFSFLVQSTFDRVQYFGPSRVIRRNN